MIVADASVIIALAKIGKLWLLNALFEEIAITTQVKVEVIDQGKAIRALEVNGVEQGLREGWLREVQLTTRERRLAEQILKDTQLDKGESESLAVTSVRKLMVLIDDKEARAMAKAMDIAYLGSAGVLIEGFNKRHLSREDLEVAVRDLARVIWLSPEVITAVLKTAREVEE